jgi:fatty-acyl-CoA synthase
MDGLMMDYQLNTPAMLRRAETLHARKSIVSRNVDRSLHRYTYAECVARARRLSVALATLGLRKGDRVASFCWNHYRHLEAYYAVPASGLVLHTLNIRLHPDELAYIANHAGDRAAIVDASLWPAFEKFRDRVPFEHVIVVGDDGRVPPGTLDYDTLIAVTDATGFDFPDVPENSAGVMCYTSGTTGKPKGVVYSHRALALHSLGASLADTFGTRERDVMLAVVPMFHANAWGTPFSCALLGSAQVLPGAHLDPKSIVELLATERVTITAGVPTIWFGILQYLDAHPGEYDLSALHTMLVGGAAIPEAVIRAFQDRHGLRVVHAWGMTEMTPMGSVATLTSELLDAPSDVQFAYRAKQGPPVPFVEARARSEQGLIPWDGQTMGELEVRGPWVARAYYQAPDSVDRFTDDGWFRTGDVVTIERNGYITIQDRAKDLVKSGGEWISSVALESALAAHPDIAECVVIGIPHPRWDERPMAVVVPREGRSPTLESIHTLLAPQFAKWWLPDAVVTVPAIPKTGTGKYMKHVLRDQFREYYQGVIETLGESGEVIARAPASPG